jgi:molybdate transport system substrate-binding protein
MELKHFAPTILAVLALIVFGVESRADDIAPVRVLAAGSLRAAITQEAAAFQHQFGVRVDSAFGPSGVLRERIEKGEATDLFASADMGNPSALSQAGKAGPVTLFARNQLCAFVRPGLSITPSTLLGTMLDSQIKLGTSTPKSDPAGDYTWSMFAKADAVRPGRGSGALLETKALQLIGGPNSAAPPAGIDVFAWHLREGHADIFIGYCSATASFTKDLPGGTVVGMPSDLATGAEYGLAVLLPKNRNAELLEFFIISEDGQKILQQNGFDAPLLPPQAQ